ncbi:MAG TPA: hypothetical protein VHK69_13040 [Chitinophagaceae bacterium]|jgi:hypothetical protein|nr:hypothetical protein [Chitinophagaceae bacterium]
MATKPVTPKLHGILDYGFSAVQLSAPLLPLLSRQAKFIYPALGTTFLALNALSQTPVALKPLIPMKVHRKTDQGFLVGLAALTLLPAIRKNRKTLLFHGAFLALALTHYLLTDYRD